jgi:hypothetical protein
LNGTPVSVRRSENQFTPELLRKVSVPEPLAGVEKLKFVPTGVQLVHVGSLIITFGSGNEFANTTAEHPRTSKSTRNTRADFMKPPTPGRIQI